MGIENLDPVSRKIWEEVVENSRKRAKCTFHEFEVMGEKKFGAKYKCKNCGCIESGSFILAYAQGLEHGRKEKS